MYTRQHVCILADIDVERFKNLARRNQLPTAFFSPDAVNENSLDHMQTPGWNRFSTLQAASIAVSEAFHQKMGYADGLSAVAAATIASNNLAGIDEALQSWRTSGVKSSADVWAGYVGFLDQGGENVFGTLRVLSEKISEYSARALDSESPARIFLVNVSEIIREMEKRANDAGIRFPGEDVT